MTTFNFNRSSKSRTLTSFTKLKSVWPNPQESTGTWYRKMGKYNCWEARGPARESFTKLAEEIKAYLEKCSDAVIPYVTWSMYMIGKKEETAIPTVMFCCEQPNPRKFVRKLIEESGILNKYPGITVGDCTDAPDVGHLVQLAGGDMMSYGTPITPTDTKKTVLYAPSPGILGARIYIKGYDGEQPAFRKATAGGIIQLGGRDFVQTVAHAFMGSPELESYEGKTGGDFEFDIEGLGDSDEAEDESIATSDNGMVPLEYGCPRNPTTLDDMLSDTSTDVAGLLYDGNDGGEFPLNTILERKNTTTNLHRTNLGHSGVQTLPLSTLGDLVFSSADGPRTDLDYALIEIEPSTLHTFDKVAHTTRVPAMKLVDANVVAFTGSRGPISGKLSGTPSFLRLPYQKTFQEVWTVRLAESLAKGDCGSWVVDSESGDVYGHLIAGNPESGIAYIVPAYQVHEHMKTCFNSKMKQVSGPPELHEQASKPNYVHEVSWPRLYLNRKKRSPISEDLNDTRRKRIHASFESEANRRPYWIMLVAGIGFFTDAYHIFSMNIILPMISIVYFKGTLGRNIGAATNMATLSAVPIGQVLFGIMGDRLGRRKMYGFGLMIIIICDMGMATASNGYGASSSLHSWLIFWRFILGFGIGGDYPLSAVITSEFAPTRLRGRMLTVAFFCQTLGQLAAPLVALVAAQGVANQLVHLDDTCDADCLRTVDRLWRVVVAIGAIPACVALILRFAIPESPRYLAHVMNSTSLSAHASTTRFSIVREGHHCEVDGERKGLDDMQESLEKSIAAEDLATQPKFSWTDYKDYFWKRENWEILLATSLSWFLVDFTFYGLSLNSPLILGQIWSEQPGSETQVHAALIRNGWRSSLVGSLGSLIGGLIIFFSIERLGRRLIQMNGFFWLSVLFLILGTSIRYLRSGHGSTVMVILFILCQAFFNFGPYITTFIIPAEIFPTRYRCTSHGISAAFGKIGSVVAQVFIAYAKFSGTEYGSSEWLGYVLIVFSAFMLLGAVTTFYWIPDIGRKGGTSQTLERLAGGKRVDPLELWEDLGDGH